MKMIILSSGILPKMEGDPGNFYNYYWTRFENLKNRLHFVICPFREKDRHFIHLKVIFVAYTKRLSASVTSIH